MVILSRLKYKEDLCHAKKRRNGCKRSRCGTYFINSENWRRRKMKNFKIRGAQKKMYNVVSWANVPSETGKGSYTVVKVSKSRAWKYRCTCPDYMFRSSECKHIQAFRQKEREK
jgi:ribosomal protein L11 methylase PrmA